MKNEKKAEVRSKEALEAKKRANQAYQHAVEAINRILKELDDYANSGESAGSCNKEHPSE